MADAPAQTVDSEFEKRRQQLEIEKLEQENHILKRRWTQPAVLSAAISTLVAFISTITSIATVVIAVRSLHVDSRNVELDAKAAILDKREAEADAKAARQQVMDLTGRVASINQGLVASQKRLEAAAVAMFGVAPHPTREQIDHFNAALAKMDLALVVVMNLSRTAVLVGDEGDFGNGMVHMPEAGETSGPWLGKELSVIGERYPGPFTTGNTKELQPGMSCAVALRTHEAAISVLHSAPGLPGSGREDVRILNPKGVSWLLWDGKSAVQTTNPATQPAATRLSGG